MQGFPAIASIIAPWQAWHCNLLADSCLPQQEGDVVLSTAMKREDCDGRTMQIRQFEKPVFLMTVSPVTTAHEVPVKDYLSLQISKLHE